MSETATIHVHICDQRRGFNATFSTEDQAIAFLSARNSTHARWESESNPVPLTWTKLIDFLYPTCEHGMMADQCYGPNHFMDADQERAMNWDYSDAPSGW